MNAICEVHKRTTLRWPYCGSGSAFSKQYIRCRIADSDPHSVGPLDLASEWDPVPAIDRRKIFAKFTKEISNVEQKYWKRKIPKFHQK
jgi:hypothetical protein